MIDYIKLMVPHIDFNLLKVQTGLDFTIGLNQDTGVISSKRYDKNGSVRLVFTHIAQKGEIEFIVKEVHFSKKVSYHLTVKGSIHKNHFIRHNGKGENYDDFELHMVIYQLRNIANFTGLRSEDFIIRNIEFGVNIEIPYNPKEFLANRLILHKGQEFIPFTPGTNGKSLGYFNKHMQYWLKLYDKGMQYSLPFNLLRVELKYVRMGMLNGLGIRTMFDLMNVGNIQRLKPLLLLKWDEVLLNEDIIDDAINKADKRFIENCANPRHWLKFRETKNGYNNNRAKFIRMQKRYCSDIKSEIAMLIDSKFDALLK